jgi:hypothetical protein
VQRNRRLVLQSTRNQLKKALPKRSFMVFLSLIVRTLLVGSFNTNADHCENFVRMSMHYSVFTCKMLLISGEIHALELESPYAVLASQQKCQHDFSKNIKKILAANKVSNGTIANRSINQEVFIIST